MKDKFTTTSGITLISLVVTMVIIIILSTITISTVFGEDGLFKKSENIKEMHEISTSEEENYTNEVLNEYKYANDKWILTKDEDGTPIVVRGNQILEVGDYIDYDPTADLSEDALTYYKSDILKNGYGNQEFYLTGNSVSYDTETYGWRVLGADDKGQLLIVSEDFVQPVSGGNEENGRVHYILKGQAGYVNGINELNEISTLYGQGKYAVSARSITIEDIDKITRYIPQIGGYGVGTIGAYGNQITYTRTNESTISFSGNNGTTGTGSYDKFIYYKNGQWKSLEIGESMFVKSTYYTYYPDTLKNNSTGELLGISKDTHAYEMLFLNGYNSNNPESITGFEYWLRFYL